MKPTVIFVHGLGLTGDVWTPQQEWCRQHGIESIALTLPGHGVRRDDTASIEAMVGEIVATARRLEKVVLVGHSFGGLLSTLAAPRISNLETMLLINPLLDPTQIRGLFSSCIKIAGIMQSFIPESGPGKFARGNKFFWKWGVYPYCLWHNSADILEKLYVEIKKLGGIAPPSSARCTVLVSRSDKVLKPPATGRSTIIPVSGHMLPRLAAGAINSFLANELIT